MPDVAVGKKRQGRKKIKLSSKFPDLEGIFYGKTPKEIVLYCIKEERFDIIKF